MSYPFRPEFQKKPKRVVVKVGSQCLVHPQKGLQRSVLKNLAKDISELYSHHVEVVLVSSGAIALGAVKGQVQSQRLPALQAASSIGQPLLMQSYQKAFQPFGIQVAQILLTHEDIKNHTRYFNLKNTFEELLKKHIPIVNENDSVSFEEISLGDNDQLATMVAEMIGAQALVFLSGTKGLWIDGQYVEHLSYCPHWLKKVHFFKKSPLGKGGIHYKLQAIQKALSLGIPAILTDYKGSTPIASALKEQAGTFFEPKPLLNLNGTKKVRILARVKPHAFIKVDEGAYKALNKNASLLPVGVTQVKGPFQRGDAIAIRFKGKVIGYGYSEYSSKDVSKILGKQTKELPKLLDFVPSRVIIHRNNLILLKD